MNVVVWITEDTWPACVDAARVRTLDDEQPVLLHIPQDGRPADELLDAAADRLGRGAARRIRHGRVEVEVVHEAAGAELLICARDGDRTRLGPGSLGPRTRYVVDHAPCPVLLVWPDAAPSAGRPS